MWYDISVILGKGDITYPGDPKYKRESVQRLADGDPYALSSLAMSSHAGTHLDAPAHFFKDGLAIDEIPVTDLILPARVVDLSGNRMVTVSDLTETKMPEGGAVLFRTRNSAEGLLDRDKYCSDYAALTEGACELIVESGVKLAGLDYISVDPGDDAEFLCHRKLLGSGVYILESVDLREVPQGCYTLYCFPLRVWGAEAAPARAVLGPPEDR